jgi:long-chain acyl-CoA synthetase
MPKGVMLSHRNICSNMGAIREFDGKVFDLYEDDTYISYLPLAHVFERHFMIACLAYKVKYGFY